MYNQITEYSRDVLSKVIFLFTAQSFNFTKPYFAGISLGLEKYLFKFSFGSVSVSAAYQAVYSNGELLHNQFDHGPCAILQMYFSKIAIPGIGLGGAYNVDKNLWQFAFSIGMMF